ncbi:MAG: hypothetical protein PME_23340 [Priestia megaterium]
MLGEIVEVDYLKGPNYTKGIIVFYKGGENGIRVKAKYNSTESYNDVHHVEMSDIEILQERYPDIMPDRKDCISTKEWGFKLENALSKIMKLYSLVMEIPQKNGESEIVKYVWKDTLWDANRHKE